MSEAGTPEAVLEVAPAPETPAANAESVQNVAAEAPAEKPETPAQEELTPEQVAKRNQNRLDRKLDKAYRQRAEAQARAEQLAQEVERLRQSQQPAIQATDPSAPDINQFQTIEEFVAARDKYAASKAIREYEARQQQARNEQHVKAVQSTWEERLEKAIEKNPDINQSLSDLKPNTALTAAIMESDIGPEIAHYLLTHPAEDRRIGNLPPVSQIRAIGQLEAKLSSEPVKPKQPSQAPAPIKSLGGKSIAASAEPQDSDDINTWMKKANALSKARMAGAA